MTAAAAITRKEFLHGLWPWPRRAADDRARPVADDVPPQAHPADVADLGALGADFPPEMLNQEAERLGLDPRTVDRDTLLRAVFRKMQDQHRS